MMKKSYNFIIMTISTNAESLKVLRQSNSAVETQASDRLREALARIPFASVGESQVAPKIDLLGIPWSADFILPIAAQGQLWKLVCEVKSVAQPRHVREAILMLKEYQRSFNQPNVVPLIMAPYISPEVAGMCLAANVSHADFVGNCHLAFGNIFIERQGVPNPKVEIRPLRSIFAPKASRILRTLLRDPTRPWKVEDLATTSGTSLGQASNLRRALLDQEWARITADGIVLTRPSSLLDVWRAAYMPPRGQRKRYYSLLQGEALDQLIVDALLSNTGSRHAILSITSAATWIAPYLRSSTRSFYADAIGETSLVEMLHLSPVEKGENVTIDVIDDESIFAEAIEPAPGRWCTGLVQTYLDLWRAGERGKEAAEHLRLTRIEPTWEPRLD